ncbi:MAG: PD40 domain-containing protein [Planctomycetes bacterium]|nr:PD40 domain-containing protein [Planctomycetota bacterium]
MNSSILLTVFLALVLLQPRDDARPNFFPPTPIAELNTPCREKGPWISCDGLRLYFTSDRPECAPTERAMNIWRASRRSVEDEFGSPEVVMIDGGDPSLSADELTLFFVRVAAGPLRRNLDLFVSQRPSTDAAFGNPSPVLGPNSPFDEVGPSVSADGRRLYFASNRPGGLGEYDLWCCERASDVDPFGAPRNLVELNSSGEEANPTVAADELSLCFASDRPGSRGMDLYWASRTAPDDTFDVPVNLVDLNSPRVDKAPALTCDGRLLVFRSTRDGGAGLSDLYVARRDLPPAPANARPQPVRFDREESPEIQIQALRTPMRDVSKGDPLPWTARVFVDPDKLRPGHVPEWEHFRVYVGLVDSNCADRAAAESEVMYEEAPLVSVELTDAEGLATPDPEGLWFRKIRFEPPAPLRERLSAARGDRAPMVAVRAEVSIAGASEPSSSANRRVRSDVAMGIDSRVESGGVFHLDRPLAVGWVKSKPALAADARRELRLAGTGFVRNVASVVTFEDEHGEAVATTRGIVLNEFMMRCPLPSALAEHAGPLRIRVSNGPREVALRVDSIAGI